MRKDDFDADQGIPHDTTTMTTSRSMSTRLRKRSKKPSSSILKARSSWR